MITESNVLYPYSRDMSMWTFHRYHVVTTGEPAVVHAPTERGAFILLETLIRRGEVAPDA